MAEHLPFVFLWLLTLIGLVALWQRGLRTGRELRRGRQLQQTLLDHVDNAIMALDADYRVVFVNARYLALWQFDAAFFATRPTIAAVIADVCRRGLYDESDAEALIATRLAQLATARGETALETPRRDGVIVEGFAARLPDGGFLLTFRDVTARQRAEGEVRHSREHLRTLVETVPHGILECDLTGRVTFVNQVYRTMQQPIHDGELLGASIFDLIGDNESRSAARSVFARNLATGLTHGTELVRNRTQSGETLWRQVDWAARHNAAGAIDGFIAVVTDITERVAHEEREQHALASVRGVLHNAPLAMAVIDGADTVVLWNRAAVRLLGWEEGEMAGNGLARVSLPAEQRAAFAALLATARAGGTARAELTMLPRPGGTLEVAITAGPLSPGGARGEVALIIDDIADRRRAELALRHSEKTYRQLVEASPVAIFVHIDGYLVYLNPAAVRLFGGKSAAELEGRAIDEFLGGSDRYLFHQGLALTAEDEDVVNRLELRILPLDGGERDIEATFLGIDYNGCETRMALCLDVTERNRATAELRLSEYRYRAIFDQAFQFSGLLDPQGRLLEANRSALDFIGGDNEALRGRYFWETPWWTPFPDYQQQLRQAIARGIEGESSRFEVLHRGRRDEERWIDFSLKPVRDAWGQVIYLVAEGRDITARKRTEELTLLVAQGVGAETGAEFFRSLTRYLARALQADYVLVGEIAGSEVQVVAGIGHGAELPPFSYSLAGTPCATVAGGGTICSFPQGVSARFPDDHLLVEMEIEGYTGSPLLDSGGAPLGILVVLFAKPIKDLPLVESLLRIFASRAAAELQRRRDERILADSEQRYRQLSHEFETIFNGIPDSLTVWNRDLTLVWGNRASEVFYRVPLSQLTTPCPELCPLCCGDGDGCLVERCFTSGRSDEVIRTTSDGRSWGIKTFPLRDEDGDVTRVIRLATDISEKVRLRDEAARASHLAALGELSAGVAHEINNPTGLILIDMPIVRDALRDALPLLEERFRRHGDFDLGGLPFSLLREQLPQMVDEVLDGAQRIKQIVDELREFSHPVDHRQFTRVDLDAVARKAGQLVASQIRKATDHFRIVCPAPLPPCTGNPLRLEQVLINLLLNACQALPARNHAIEVTLRHLPERACNLIEVRDEGLGIPADLLPQVTDPFFTTRRERGGTGLGLSVSTRIIEEHGGTLHIASTPGAGTTVTMTLPVSPGDTP